MKMAGGKHARLSDDQDSQRGVSAKRAVRVPMKFAELTFRISRCGDPTVCYVESVPEELRFDLIERLDMANMTREVSFQFTLDRDEMKGVSLPTVLEWVHESGWDYKQFAPSGETPKEWWRVYLFTKEHVADPTP